MSLVFKKHSLQKCQVKGVKHQRLIKPKSIKQQLKIHFQFRINLLLCGEGKTISGSTEKTEAKPTVENVQPEQRDDRA